MALAVAVTAAFLGAMFSPITSPSAQNRPETVYQCKKAYKPGTKARDNCIKRVQAQNSSRRKGDNCNVPYRAGWGSSNERSGDTHLIKLDYEPADDGRSTLRWRVVPRLEICKVRIMLYNRQYVQPTWSDRTSGYYQEIDSGIASAYVYARRVPR